MEDDTDLREAEFHNTVREYILCFLLFLGLYGCSYAIICMLRKRSKEECPPDYEEEATVYRIVLALCTFSLASSLGAALLLPMSIISNEILLYYPSSYYIKWLNSSLIQGLWNWIFAFSNISLLILLPFAYFFTEAEGFPGSRGGLLARAYESIAELCLLFLMIFGMDLIINGVLDQNHSMLDRLFNVRRSYLPFVYSCISSFGVLFLLVCTPVGFARLFTLMGTTVLKPQFLKDAHDEYHMARLQKDTLQRYKQMDNKAGSRIRNGHKPHNVEHCCNLLEIQRHVRELDVRRRVGALRRNVGYPIVLLLLLLLTVFALLKVINNTVQLLIGIKALPASSKQFTLGIESLSSLGWIGAGLEIVLIGYLLLTSIVGLYSLPGLRHIRPRLGNTPMTQIIINSAMLLVLSSALPLLARILGITNFDLLGEFGQIKWLGEFWLVLLYNVGFAGASALCIVNQFSKPVREALWAKVKQAVVGPSSLYKQDASICLTPR